MEQFPLVLIAVIIVLIWLFNSLNVLREYERGVIFRIGRLMGEPKGPGLIWVIWPIDRIVRVSLRTITMDVPTQDVITKDNSGRHHKRQRRPENKQPHSPSR